MVLGWIKENGQKANEMPFITRIGQSKVQQVDGVEEINGIGVVVEMK